MKVRSEPIETLIAQVYQPQMQKLKRWKECMIRLKNYTKEMERDSIRNYKTLPGADTDTDHNLLIANL
ncbi:hypothetical protein J437_LFUL012475 [Ladona fulva]|uniref:Uncharacterized protein n=1 Tax=Ladona fulva TaxID=123851 RepID=A0A8K0K0S8_LADFU|nr:hypothetical protein J437_LFUL012475 [Ladona fulva]